jgi:hypothetical protein
MLRTMLMGAAVASVLLSAAPTAVFAQPPSPPEIARRIDHGVRRAVTHTDRAVRRTTHRSHHRVRTVTRRTVRRTIRARCNDGRVHVGRTRFTACANHGGVRG